MFCCLYLSDRKYHTAEFSQRFEQKEKVFQILFFIFLIFLNELKPDHETFAKEKTAGVPAGRASAILSSFIIPRPFNPIEVSLYIGI